MRNIRSPRLGQVLRGGVAFAAVTALTACGSTGTTTAPPTATTIVVTSGLTQTAVVGTQLAAPIVVQIRDQFGNPVVGINVNFSPTTPSGTLSASKATTDATGSAQVSWTLGTVAGQDTIYVTAAALTAVSVYATATAGPAASMTVVAGNNQTAHAGSTLPTPLAARVFDKYGNVVAGASIAWANDAGGVLSSATTTSDSNGIAQVAYTLGQIAGPQNVTATATGNAAVFAKFVETAN